MKTWSDGILSIATAVPNDSLSTFEMLNALGDRISPTLTTSIESLGVENRYSCVRNFLDFLTGKAPRKLACTTTDLGAAAAEKCLQDVDPANVGLLIGMTNTSDRHLPCFAYEVQNKLLQHRVPADINILSLENEGCSALLKGIEAAQNYLHAHPDKLALLVAAEGHSGFFSPLSEKQYLSFHELKANNCDQKDMLGTLSLVTNFLFGDGAVALVLGQHGNKGSFNTIKHLTNIDENDIHTIYMNEGGMLVPKYDGYPHYILTRHVPETGKIYADKITQMIFEEPDSLINKPADADHFLVHTGSKKILDTIKNKIQHADDKSAVSYEILNQHGNLSTCSVGFMLAKCIEENLKGKALIISFGVGFSASAATFLFTE